MGLFMGFLFHWFVLCFINTTLPISIALIVSLVVESFSPPTLFLSFSIVLAISCLLSLHINFRVSLSIATKEVARIFLLGLVRSSWEEETSWYYQVFQSMNVWHLSIYLLLWFHPEYCSFLHNDLVHILLDLYLSFELDKKVLQVFL